MHDYARRSPLPTPGGKPCGISRGQAPSSPVQHKVSLRCHPPVQFVPLPPEFLRICSSSSSSAAAASCSIITSDSSIIIAMLHAQHDCFFLWLLTLVREELLLLGKLLLNVFAIMRSTASQTTARCGHNDTRECTAEAETLNPEAHFTALNSKAGAGRMAELQTQHPQL